MSSPRRSASAASAFSRSPSSRLSAIFASASSAAPWPRRRPTCFDTVLTWLRTSSRSAARRRCSASRARTCSTTADVPGPRRSSAAATASGSVRMRRRSSMAHEAPGQVRRPRTCWPGRGWLTCLASRGGTVRCTVVRTRKERPRWTPASCSRACSTYAVLAVVADEDAYGYDIVRRAPRGQGSTTSATPRSIGTLRRLFRSGALSSYVVPSDEGPHRKSYALTPAGQRGDAHRDQDLAPLRRRPRRPARTRREGGSMTTTTTDPTLDERASAYLAQVRDRLADLPASAPATTCSTTSRRTSTRWRPPPRGPSTTRSARRPRSRPSCGPGRPGAVGGRPTPTSTASGSGATPCTTTRGRGPRSASSPSCAPPGGPPAAGCWCGSWPRRPAATRARSRCPSRSAAPSSACSPRCPPWSGRCASFGATWPRWHWLVNAFAVLGAILFVDAAGHRSPRFRTSSTATLGRLGAVRRPGHAVAIRRLAGHRPRRLRARRAPHIRGHDRRPGRHPLRGGTRSCPAHDRPRLLAEPRRHVGSGGGAADTDHPAGPVRPRPVHDGHHRSGVVDVGG